MLEITLITIIIVSLIGFNDHYFRERLLFSTDDILHHGEQYRMITSGFLHADFFHIAFNLFALYSFGRAIQFVWGDGFFILLFLGGVIGGNLLSLLMHRNHSYRALGASGGVSAVIIAAIFLLPNMGRIYIYGVIPIPAYIFAPLFIAGSMYGMQTQRGNIGHDAHLGGAVTGVLFALIRKPTIIQEQPLLFAIYIGLITLYFSYLLITGGNTGIKSFYKVQRPQKKPKISRPRFAEKGSYKYEIEHPTKEEIDDILAKISKCGLNSLSKNEKELLQKGADKLSKMKKKKP